MKDDALTMHRRIEVMDVFYVEAKFPNDTPRRFVGNQIISIHGNIEFSSYANMKIVGESNIEHIDVSKWVQRER